MKKLKNPGFEAVFYAGLLLLMILPALVFAQRGPTKVLTIVVKGTDTLVNGQKWNTLSTDQRNAATKAFTNLATDAPGKAPLFSMRLDSRMVPPQLDSSSQFYFYPDSNTKKLPRIRFYNLPVTDMHYKSFGGDSVSLHPGFKMDDDKLRGVRVITERRRDYDNAPDRMPTMRPDMSQFRMPGMRMPDSRDNQQFDFSTVDKNGIATRENFEVFNAPAEMLKTLAGKTKADLDVYDLTLTPEFSTGKTLLMFTVPAGANAEVSLSNTEGKQLWADKATGTKFSKSFALPLNGVYYLNVKQGAKATVKQIVKQ